MERYQPMEFRLGYMEAGPSYHGFMRRDPLYRWVKHWTRGWDKVEPFLPRTEAERFRADHEGRWEGDVLVFSDPVTGEPIRVESNGDGLYPLRDLGRRPAVVEWVAVFPDWPAGQLDGATIARLLDTPLPKGLHPKNRQPVIDRLHDVAEEHDLVDALQLAGTDYARERLAYLISVHRRPAQAAAEAIPLIVDRLDHTDDPRLRARYAEAVAELAQRAPGAVKAFLGRIEEAQAAERDERTRDELSVALQALGVRAAESPFFGEARAAFDFLVDEFGFEPPVAISGPYSDTVTYRGPGIAIEASWDRRDRLAEVEVVRLDEQGALPAAVSDDELVENRLPWWALLPADEAGADADQLPAAARALRDRPDYLRGDLAQWDNDVARWSDEPPA